MKINQNRIIYLDILRSIAIILIVLEHLTRMFVYNYKSWLFASGLFSITRIGVPLFFTISGALLLTRQETISNFLKKRLGRIFPPFIFLDYYLYNYRHSYMEIPTILKFIYRNNFWRN